VSDESRERDIDRRSFVKLAGTATATAALAGCGSSGGGGVAEGEDETADTSQSGETAADTDESSTGSNEFPVTITQGQMPDTLDPHDHRNIPADIVMRQCYEGVISRNRQGQIVSMLATEWRRVEPGRG
jgi:ABC-type dipeptide transport system, periplasmic component